MGGPQDRRRHKAIAGPPGPTTRGPFSPCAEQWLLQGLAWHIAEVGAQGDGAGSGIRQTEGQSPLCCSLTGCPWASVSPP